jgi:hypothetical protein
MFGIPMNLLLAGALIAAVLLPRLWPLVKNYLPSLGSLIPNFSTSDEVDADEWKRIRRHKAWRCPECQEAIKVLNAHFLDEVVA